MAYKNGHFDIVKLMFKSVSTFSINFNARHVNGMTHFDFPLEK